ncbi:MAG: hypothetical protein IJ760_07735 [Bacteroidales bacterium]|nr:hypothetical protein [Bacteroidales bacterium]
MKEFLALEQAINHGWVITPDKSTNDEYGSHIATNCEQLGSVINDEWRTLDPAMPLFLSTINPAHLVRREVKVPTSGDAIITIYNGVEDIDGVRVQALGEDFVIGLHDLDNGKDNFTYDEAMKRLEELGKQTFNRKQAAIICIYLDQINEKLEEAGGEPFAEDWYTTNELYIPKGSSADYYATHSWYFNGAYGVLTGNTRYNTGFRSRPSLALPLPL